MIHTCRANVQMIAVWLVKMNGLNTPWRQMTTPNVLQAKNSYFSKIVYSNVINTNVKVNFILEFS